MNVKVCRFCGDPNKPAHTYNTYVRIDGSVHRTFICSDCKRARRMDIPYKPRKKKNIYDQPLSKILDYGKAKNKALMEKYSQNLNVNN